MITYFMGQSEYEPFISFKVVFTSLDHIYINKTWLYEGNVF